MQTLDANNPDGKGPRRDAGNKPTADDPDLHNPQPRIIKPGDGERLDVHGGPTNRENSSMVEAAEGEIPSTPQGP